ncbi:hypothetical protein BDV95DRAFT_607806 [Massariosphaeria phaeospora]|uniref:Calpain catalytic domain-containing protein n=1 Tax=Massariosphaeria phaeospora TaxID=100035 RepID=A0A7C8M524_9PLEO|nr:hypothetical protein BDV95DRAFT_607806 [Massariosphaeria phaeospora]
MSSTSGEEELRGPQEILNEFWENLVTKKPSKVTSIFPSSLYANLLPPHPKTGPAQGKNAAESYEAAATECRARVKRIVRECRRTNEKFTDPDFDIEGDRGINNCLSGLLNWYNDSAARGTTVSPWRLGNALATLAESDLLNPPNLIVDLATAANILTAEESNSSAPGSIHRIDWIFEKPSFTVDGFSGVDVRQGANGDCWFIAAVASICSDPTLMDKICVERNEECGVYGFVFYRDGEWTSTVVDDNLYLTCSDFDAFGDDYDPSGTKEKKYKKNKQTGSDALYFASCADENETWLPLLEKAYAKVHGDYHCIAGGISGEAIEDLTGGVTTKVLTNRVLSKERLWKELLQVNEGFLFSASSPGSYGDDTNTRRGLALSHAYSVDKAIEEEDEQGKKHRLVLIRNPWGERNYLGDGEWNGPWSDGSKEWTPYWMQKLNYRFGDDGLFWMSYDDLLKRFALLDRTRLFDKDWTVVQHWTSVSVAWVTGFLNTKFVVEIKKAGPTVFVLCQLDHRYFRGLEGKYRFDLHFLLQEQNAPAGDHIVRARGAWFGNRSISAEVDLEPGRYEVVPKIVAERIPSAPEVYEVVTKVAESNPQKLRQIGMNYDVANAKGIVELSEEEQKLKEKKQKETKDKKKKEEEDAAKEKAEFEAWKKEKKEREVKEKEVKDEPKADDTINPSKPQDTTTPEQKEKESITDSSVVAKEESIATIEEEQPSDEDQSEASADTTKIESDVQADNANDKTTETPSAQAVEADSVVQATGGDEIPQYALGAGPNEVEGDAAHEPAANAPAPTVSKHNPWNAVCALGLRVYSQDPEVSIRLVKPKDVEEGAVLNTDGSTQAGATM